LVTNTKIGLLALQGDFEKHQKQLERINVDVLLVKHDYQLEDIDGLILPGGESTTILKLLESEPSLKSKLSNFKKPLLATCAGLILIAKEVTNPEQSSLDLIDITVARNAYGRQVDSFIDTVELSKIGAKLLGQESIEGIFIRAPRITSIEPKVEILASHNETPVFVKQKQVFGASFHPELSEGLSPIHHFFANYCEKFASQRP